MTAIEIIVQRNGVILYDGTNGAAAVALISNASIVSDNGTTLVVTNGDSQWTLMAGDYLSVMPGGTLGGYYTAAELASHWHVL